MRSLNKEIIAVSVSGKKGERKHNVESISLREDFGIAGDAHAGSGRRQVSFLAEESIKKMRLKGLYVRPGDFAENITTRGVDLLKLKIGKRLKAGDGVIFEVSQIGKVCHARCDIYYQAGDCVMPREGVFARVLKGGTLKPGDTLEILKNAKRTKRATEWRRRTNRKI
ncbi:MAG: MOSC domain-containing protein [Candidatus Omnitrophota bacterium]|nr:MOSC domain-containing protein [Candidatus Omnitrophota bacterium]